MKIKINTGEDRNRHRGHRQSPSQSLSSGDIGKVTERTEERITMGKGELNVCSEMLGDDCRCC